MICYLFKTIQMMLNGSPLKINEPWTNIYRSLIDPENTQLHTYVVERQHDNCYPAGKFEFSSQS